MKKAFWIVLLAVFIANLILWIILNPIEQNEVAVIGSAIFFNRILAVITTLVEAIVIATKVSAMCKTKSSKEADGRPNKKNVIQIIIIILLAALIMTFCRFSYQKIDNNGYSFVSPINQYTYLWEDMEYYADYSTEFGSRTYVKFSKVEYVSRFIHDDIADLNLKLFRFNRLTNAAKDEYKTEDGLLNDIFVNKYGHLEAEWGGKGIGYVLKNDIE